MLIAIVGGGISGLTAAYRLHPRHAITLFEAGSYAGGHTNTIDVEHDGERHALDTGFLVFNDRTYPHFSALLAELGVRSRATSMSFSVRADAADLEYNGTSLNGLFAQRRNLVRPAFYRLLGDVASLQTVGRRVDGEPRRRGPNRREFLAEHRFSREFVDYYLLPMGAAIWSCPPGTFARFPIRFIVEFYRNHGLLDIRKRPTWFVIEGGSRTYVEKLTAAFASDSAQFGRRAVRRSEEQVELFVRGGAAAETFDHVVFACHADQASAMLADPSPDELRILGAFPYERNVAVVHTDLGLLPRRPRAWAAWNYLLLADRNGAPPAISAAATVTYNLNILQHIASRHSYNVTLNAEDRIDPTKVLRRIEYMHPIFTTERAQAQAAHTAISGRRRTSYCGAYWAPGFMKTESSVPNAFAERSTMPTVSMVTLQRPSPSRRELHDELLLRRGGRSSPLRHGRADVHVSAVHDLRRSRGARRAVRPARVVVDALLGGSRAFRRADYLGGPSEPLDVSVRKLVAERTGVAPTGPIRLLTNFRSFGFGMNPVSFYFCYDATGAHVETLVAEVTNTPWNERHCYVVPWPVANGRARPTTAKALHVSPFLEMAMSYRWNLSEPGGAIDPRHREPHGRRQAVRGGAGSAARRDVARGDAAYVAALSAADVADRRRDLLAGAVAVVARRAVRAASRRDRRRQRSRR